MSKKSGCMAGSVIGSILRFFISGIQLLIKIIMQVLFYTGLWIPAIYILFGFILYWAFGFNPLDWHLEGQLYVSGLIACTLCSLVITIRNIIVKPAKSVYKGYKKPIWTRKKSDGDEVVVVKKQTADKVDVNIAEEIQKPRPSIYYSTLEENTLIHEYDDRFEIYRIENNKARLERVEYKDE